MRATRSSPHSTHIRVIAMLTAAMSSSAQVLTSAMRSSQSSIRATVRILLLLTPCHRAHCSLAPRSLIGVTQSPRAYWPGMSKLRAMVAVAGPVPASAACALLGSQRSSSRKQQQPQAAVQPSSSSNPAAACSAVIGAQQQHGAAARSSSSSMCVRRAAARQAAAAAKVAAAQAAATQAAAAHRRHAVPVGRRRPSWAPGQNAGSGIVNAAFQRQLERRACGSPALACTRGRTHEQSL